MKKKIQFPNMPSIEGIKIGVTNSGIKKNNKLDLVIFKIPKNSYIVAVFTKNSFCAAPVVIARKNLVNKRKIRYLLINSGNANACVGNRGITDTQKCCLSLAKLTKIKIYQILPYSTGIIGKYLPTKNIIESFPVILNNLSNLNWKNAANGISTTDTYPKGICKIIYIYGERIIINGVCKGSGMIQPNMGTMLSYIITDIKISQYELKTILEKNIKKSFNRITVDSDMSTNDSCTIISTNKGLKINNFKKNSIVNLFIKESLIELAQLIIRDAEGATKFISIRVINAYSIQEALDVGYSIANSPLVKIAIYACDPNWGRILMAIGKTLIKSLDIFKISLIINGYVFFKNGCRYFQYKEKFGKKIFENKKIFIDISLNRGNKKQLIWTSDLNNNYVKINSEYRN